MSLENHYIFKKDYLQKSVENFNLYITKELYGNILIGNDIEDEWKDVKVDDE